MVDEGRVVFESAGVTLDGVVECGRRLGRALHEGDLVFLMGPLGAGKTTLVRAIADSLAVTDTVRSPSFTIANIYAGELTVQHLDLYRLDELGEEDALALEEYVSPEAVTLVEWPEAGADRLGEPQWTIELEHESLGTRRVRITALTPEAVKRWRGDASA